MNGRAGLASRLLSQHLQSADIVMHLKRRATYPGIAPFMHLDHIYYDRDFQLRDMHLLSDQAIAYRFRSPAACWPHFQSESLLQYLQRRAVYSHIAGSMGCVHDALDLFRLSIHCE